MHFHFKALSAALGIVAAAAVIAPVRAQQEQPGDGQGPIPNAGQPGGPATQAPTARPPLQAGRRATTVVANVNLRSGPGTDSEIITTIPAGSTVRLTSCSGEWCEVEWNGRSGYAIARNLGIGLPRQARTYGPAGYPGTPGPGDYPGTPGPGGYPGGYGPQPGAVYEAPGYYAPPAVVYGPGYYYGPGVYYGPGWGWRRRWWW